MPLTMKNTGTAKIASDWRLSISSQCQVGWGLYTGNVVCSSTTAKQETMFSTYTNRNTSFRFTGAGCG